MAKDRKLEWFGADVEERDEKNVASMIDGFRGVDAEVPKTREVRDPETGELKLERDLKLMPAPRGDRMRVSTSGGKNITGKLVQFRNRYKLMRSAFQFAPPDDKALWEGRMNIAFHEMQEQAFREKLENYQARTPEPRPEQVTHLQQLVAMHRGMADELRGVN